MAPCNLQFALGTWQSHLAICNLHLAIGPWPLAFAISNLTLTPCNLQRAIGTFGIETQVFWFLLLSNHVASFWVKGNLPRSPKNSITWMQWPLLIRKPIAYKPEIDPRHVRTEVGLNQAHLNSCQNSAFLWFGDFVLMLDLAFVCLYQYLFDFSPSNFFWRFFFRCFIWGNATLSQHLSWNGIIYRVLKTLIKGSPCHQKRGLFWDFVVFSTSFWFFCEIWLPLGPWHLAIAHWNLVLALGPCHWHIEIYHRTMANHDWKPKPWLSKSLVLLWILHGFIWFWFG